MKGFIQLANRGFARTTKLANVRQIVGFNYDEFVQHDNVDVYLRSGKIAKIVGKDATHIGDMSLIPDKTIDLEGAIVTPGFIDPHTHIFPPKDRADEFSKRTHMTYQEIAEGGGGILSSV
jgi:imidazolonepropionase